MSGHSCLLVPSKQQRGKKLPHDRGDGPAHGEGAEPAARSGEGRTHLLLLPYTETCFGSALLNFDSKMDRSSRQSLGRCCDQSLKTAQGPQWPGRCEKTGILEWAGEEGDVGYQLQSPNQQQQAMAAPRLNSARIWRAPPARAPGRWAKISVPSAPPCIFSCQSCFLPSLPGGAPKSSPGKCPPCKSPSWHLFLGTWPFKTLCHSLAEELRTKHLTSLCPGFLTSKQGDDSGAFHAECCEQEKSSFTQISQNSTWHTVSIQSVFTTGYYYEHFSSIGYYMNIIFFQLCLSYKSEKWS